MTSPRLFSNKFFPWRIFIRVVLVQSLLVLLALGASGLAARYFYKKTFLNQLQGKLQDTLVLLSRSMPSEIKDDWCRKNSENISLRFAVLTEQGKVLCDSTDEFLHDGLNRPEIKKALQRGFGAALRKSPGQSIEMFYAASFLANRKVIFIAAGPLEELNISVGVYDTSLGLALAFFAILLGAFAIWSGQKLVFPIGRLLLKTQRVLSRSPEPMSREDIEQDSFGEWSDLESNIDDIRRDLEAKSQSLDTERVELATIMGSISDAILAVDPEGVPRFFNSRFQVVFGSERLKEPGVKLWELFRDPDILTAFEGALKEGRMESTRTIAVEPPSGLKRFFSLSVAPLRRQDGMIYGAVGIFHDITDLKSAEQMRIDFVANVSHELRTPLTSIKGYAETLIQDMDSGKAASKEFLTVIAKNSNRLMNLMEDLLDLSSIESDHMLQKEVLEVEEITSRMVKQLQVSFSAKRQTLVTLIDTPTVLADSRRLEQILVNLLTNANKYTPEGGTITVRWHEEGNETVLRVIDTGPGIPLQSQSRIFERFYRVDKARSREQGGTGLGLAIVKHIMQRHEGRVSVESLPGHGATFICRFRGLT